MTTTSTLAKSQSPWPVIDGVPSTLIDKFGRMKTERQMLLDATRVNQYSDVGRNNPADRDRTNVITGKRITARHQ